MDWLLATPQLHSAFSCLGSFEGESYVVSPNALAILEEINYKLAYEDQTLRTFRRAIGFGQNVRSDLIPLLENAKDEAVIDSVIRILVNLTVPVECLFSVDIMYRTEVGRHTIFELNKLLYTSKEVFTDPKSTKSVVEYMKHILESDPKLTPQKCDQINNCLLLLRNVLHIPETHANFIMPTVQMNNGHPVSMQNTIIWNLFIQSIDKLLLYLMTCPQRSFWGVTMVQLIALIYKDQHVSTLQKLLNLWFEASLSESSEDNESNTSPPKQGSGDSSPMLTSDPTSDSSDNGGSKNEGSDDRRQALREETEATLQEVSRKGHEYQNAMSRMPNVKPESSQATSDINPIECELSCSSAQAAAAVATAEAMESIDDYEQNSNDQADKEADAEVEVATRAGIKQSSTSRSSSPKHITQPADNATDTTNLLLMTTANADNNTFKSPPPALPKSKSTEMDDNVKPQRAAVKLGQKSPHSGQLQLTKGKCCPQKRECPSSQSELSDCGYGTQVENQESISTSSNDDEGPQGKPQHQKPPCNTKPRKGQRSIMPAVDTKELRRKKLVKRSKSNLINMKGLVQHTPTDEDISNLLKEFTVDFLLKGYGFLVEELHTQLLSNVIPIDTSHFFWLVTYFLKFAAQLELDMEHIDSILTFDVISYLTYEGVSLCEQFELNARQEGSDLKPYLRRMHLVVTAIREFLQAIETYNKVTHLSEDDRARLRLLQLQISSTEDLRCLFVLLLRRFNPSIHTKQYLQDLVVTNHILLLILDSTSKLDGQSSIRMMEHISQFATLEVMHYYGILLEDFNSNGEFVNDCIFTMMHHIGGDMRQIGVLFQPVILKTYSRIWEADYGLCDDWSDLIEYVIHKFMKTPQKSPLTIPTTSLTEMTKVHNLENTVCHWSQEEMDTLYWYYVQSKKNNDIVGKIVKLFSNNGNKKKSRISIIQQLLQQDIITLVEYDDLMKFEDAEYQRTLLTTPTSGTTESGIDLREHGYGKPSDDIQILLDLIIKADKGQHLVWLQRLLLECCYIKLSMKKIYESPEHRSLDPIMEPVAYHCICKNKSIPLVQWNNEQATIMLYQPFVLLLHKLGFQLPADAGSIFARIPDYWTPETMYVLAKKLGPLDKLTIKFDTKELEETANISRCHYATGPRHSLSSGSSFDVDITETDELSMIPEVDTAIEKAHEIFAVPKVKHSNSIIRYTPDPSPTLAIPNWLQLVMRSKCNQQQLPSKQSDDSSNNPDDDNMSSSQKSKAYASLVATTSTTATASPPLQLLQQLEESQQQQQQQQHVTETAATAEVAAPTTKTSATTTLSCLTMMNNIIGAHNDQSSSSGCASGSAGGGASNSSQSVNNNNNSNNKTSGGSISNSNSSNNNSNSNQIQIFNVDDDAMNSYERSEAAAAAALSPKIVAGANVGSSFGVGVGISAGMCVRTISAQLEQEYSAMVASVYKSEIAICDNVSVASDLTRMYVSDEDEKHEFSVTHYH